MDTIEERLVVKGWAILANGKYDFDELKYFNADFEFQKAKNFADSVEGYDYVTIELEQREYCPTESNGVGGITYGGWSEWESVSEEYKVDNEGNW